MKKKIVLLVVAMMMCLSSICLAADNGTLLSAEEKIAGRFIEALTGKIDYADIQGDLTESMSKQLTSKKFTEVRGVIKNQFGTLTNTKLAVLEKHDNADRLFYVSNGTKEKVVELMLFFDTSGKRPFINEITMRGLPVQETAKTTK